jgi:hypothetical protein
VAITVLVEATKERVKAEYGWSQSRLRVFAQISREFPGKAAIISRSPASGKTDDFNTEVMREIVQLPDDQLEKPLMLGCLIGPYQNEMLLDTARPARFQSPNQQSQRLTWRRFRR